MSYSIDSYRTYQPMRIEYPLIHTVQSWETLEKIISEGFRPSYCTEYLSDDRREIRAGFPMISFSNMSISESLGLSKSYGTLAIAMKKDWGAKNNLSPVLYLERNSDFTQHIINSFDRIKRFTDNEVRASLLGELIGDRHIMVKTLIDIFSRAKNYDGKLIRGNKLIDEKYPFGLEREWRYLVNNEEYTSYLIGEQIDEKKRFNKKIENIRLTFSVEDIEAIIIEADYQRDLVVELLATKPNAIDYKPKIIINTTRHMPDYS